MRRSIHYLRIFGPATIVSVAYVDPGNFGSNITAGSEYALDLLWVVWLSSIIAMFLQYLSGKIGIVSGKSIVDLTLSRLNNYARRAYYIPLLSIIFATDMAEFLGIALGLHLLIGIPLHIAVIISMIDVLTLLMATDKKGILEVIVGSLVGIIGLCYIVQLYIIAPDTYQILDKSIKPSLSDSRQVILAASIVGATIMPHALLLHSYLTSDKWKGLKDMLKRHVRETIAYFTIAALINASIQIASYGAFYSKGIQITDIDKAYYTLIPLYGSFAAYVFGIALLASGVSSSLVSVIAGQRIIESIRGKSIEQWKLRLMVRLINMVPLLIALYIGIKPLDVLVYSQVVLSITLPFVVIPLIIFTSRIVRYYTKVLSIASAMFIIILNIALLITQL